ncbi:MAG: anthranilate synthase component I family protein [Polyangiaceae bacterium]
MSFARTWIADWVTPLSAYVKLRHAAQKEGGPHAASFLLESVTGGERWGRYTILGYRPKRVAVLARDGIWRVDGERIEPRGRDALEVAEEALALNRNAKPADPAERHRRAHVGFFTWDLIHQIEKVPVWPDESSIPLARFVGDATTIVFDNFLQTMTISASSQDEVDRAFEEIRSPIPLAWLASSDVRRHPVTVEENVTDAEFEALVVRSKEYIAAGDAFQIVLARKFRIAQDDIDPLAAYRAMRVLNPSPYMFFLDYPAANDAPALQILGASPETLVRLEGETMTVRPLAGTRRRGKTPEEDRALEEELLADPKELAEHVMLIDLGRNDVGRVADIGSVKLPRQMQIERYSHVMHIVSEVEGRIDRTKVPPLDVFRSAFPAGTLSGAPKLRAMQIIRELERGPRGVYGGAVGYVSESGDFDLAIAIRSATCQNGVFEVTAGAGIVEASDPAAEAAETRAKAASVLTSIGAAQRLT